MKRRVRVTLYSLLCLLCLVLGVAFLVRPSKCTWKVVENAGPEGTPALVFNGRNPPVGTWPSKSIRLLPGRRYRVKAMLRADGLSSPADGDGWTGAGVYLDWFDVSNRVLGSVTLRPVSGCTPWVVSEALTPRIHAQTVRGRLTSFVSTSCSGSARIANVQVIPELFPVVSRFISSAYRNEATSGKVTLSAEIDLPVSQVTTNLVVHFQHRQCIKGCLINNFRQAICTLNVDDLAYGTNCITCSLYAGKRRLGCASLDFVRTQAKASATSGIVRFDAFGRTEVARSPFFPIGLYTTSLTPEILQDIATSPFNCIMPYGAISSAFLDACQALSLKTLVDARSLSLEQIARYAKHPALLAWYGDDESPLLEESHLTRVYRRLKALDPNHPVWNVQDKFEDVGWFLDSFDVYGTDPYPVSRKPVSLVSKAMRLAREGGVGLKPVWQVLQAFTWNEFRRKGERTPTQRELANMTWQAIAEGANGLFYFRYHAGNEKVSPGWRCTIWPALCVIASEVNALSPILLLPPGPCVKRVPEGVSVRTWQAPEMVYVLYVNQTQKEIVLSDITLKPLGYTLGMLNSPVRESDKSLDSKSLISDRRDSSAHVSSHPDK